MDLTDPVQITTLKAAFDYSFKGPTGEKTLKFLEEFCGFMDSGPADEEDLKNHVLQYQKGKRDVYVNLIKIMSEEYTPETIAAMNKQMNQ